jgi:hypothetical protein
MRVLVATFLLVTGGCLTVRPHERELLASPEMVSPFGDDRAAGEHGDQVTQAKTGGSLPGAAPGGGCGCTL